MTFNMLLQFIIHYGPIALFIAVFAEQFGLPAPGSSLLIATGALYSAGRMAVFFSILMSVLACLVADASWYWIGRSYLAKRTDRLNLSRSMLRIYLQDRSAHFFRYGYLVFLVFKFLPGPNMVSVHVGRFGLARPRLLLFDTIASLLWVGGYTAIGFVFSNNLRYAFGLLSHVSIIPMLVVLMLIFVMGLRRSPRFNKVRDASN